MNIMAHLSLASKFRPILEEKLDIKIKPLSFLYGNIRPDIKKTKIMKYHVNHYCLEHINRLTNNIYSDIENDNLTYNKFVIELGSIFHFICDYFCLPHNEYYKGSRSQHHIYEQNEVFYIKKNADKILENLLNFQYDFTSSKDVLSAIKSLHDDYSNDTSLDNDFEKDVVYSSRACLLVGECILKAYSKKCNSRHIIFKNA